MNESTSLSNIASPRPDGLWDKDTVLSKLDDLERIFEERLKKDIREPWKRLEETETERDVARRELEQVKSEKDAMSDELQNLKRERDEALNAQNKMNSDLTEARLTISTAKDESVRLNTKLEKEEDLKANVAGMEHKLSKAYHDILQCRNNVQLYCKVRPPPSSKTASSLTGLQGWVYDSFDINAKSQRYDFHRVFGPKASNAELHDVIRPMLEITQSNNRHVLFVGFGESGSGKSTTLYDASTINQKSIIEQLAHDLWGEKAVEASEWSAGLTFVEVKASGMYSLFEDQPGSEKQRLKMSKEKTQSEMVDVPEDARYTNNLFLSYDNKKAGTQYLNRRWVKGKKNFLDMVSKGLKQRDNEKTTNNKTSSRGCALLEIRLKNNDENRGAITLVDLMGKEDYKDITDTKRENFNTGGLNVNAMLSLLKAASTHKNRAATLAKRSFTAKRDEVSKDSQYTRSGLYNLVFPIIKGEVCNSNKPLIAVIAHIYDCEDNLKRNLATLKDTKELEGSFEVVATENCASCSDREIQISDLLIKVNDKEMECKELRKQLSPLRDARG